MSVVVVAEIYPSAESRGDVIEIFSEIIPEVHAEEGCELYALHEGEDRLVMIEKWQSRAALDAHLEGPIIKALQERLGGKLAGSTNVQVLSALPAGDAARGALR